MRAGKLRHRVTIQYPVETQDAAGEPVKSWTALSSGQVWAQKEDLNGVELFRAQQIHAEITTRFTIRHRSDVDATMRVADGSNLYSIEAPIDPTGMGERLELLCKKSVDG